MKVLTAAWLFLGISATIATDIPEFGPLSVDPGVAARTAVWDDIFAGYNAQMHPENATVSLGIALVDVDIDAEEDLLEANLWIRMTWKDNRLKWDANLTSVDILRVPASQVWIPDIALYNGITPQMTFTDFNVLIYPTGEVLWVPQTNAKAYCQLTLDTDPLQEQRCSLKFGSWTYDGNVYDLQPYKDKLHADLTDFHMRKYNVTTNTAERRAKYYTCCPEPYVDITYVLGLTRRTKGSGTTCSAVPVPE